MNRTTLSIAMAAAALLTGYGAAVATETSPGMPQAQITPSGVVAQANETPAVLESAAAAGPSQAEQVRVSLEASDLESLIGEAGNSSAATTAVEPGTNSVKREPVRLKAEDLESLL